MTKTFQLFRELPYYGMGLALVSIFISLTGETLVPLFVSIPLFMLALGAEVALNHFSKRKE